MIIRLLFNVTCKLTSLLAGRRGNLCGSGEEGGGEGGGEGHYYFRVHG